MRLRYKNGVRPSGQHSRSLFSGLTSVELLVAVVLVGTTLALALPSFRAMTEKRQLTQGAEQIHAYLNSIQGIASRSNSTVTVSYSRTDNDDWCFGAVLGNVACDCTETTTTAADFCAIDGVASRLTGDHVGNSGVLASLTGDGAYTFEPVRGLLVDLDDSVAMELHSPTGSYKLRLSVSNTGQSVMCSKDSDHSVPGYKVCAAEAEEEVEETPPTQPPPEEV